MTRTTVAIITALAAVLPWAILLTTNAAMGTPGDAWLAEACSRACHNGGCSHVPVLPAALTADDGLFGAAIHGLYGIGGLTGLSSAQGYGAANLAIFCALWPGMMLGMVAIGLLQRAEISRLRSRS